MASIGKESSSSELRHDWLSDRWVLFAPQRRERPDDFAEYRPASVSDGKNCPFCTGNESLTPASVAEFRDPQCTLSAAWHVRVVPNKFPAVNGVDSLRWPPFVKAMSSGLESSASSIEPTRLAGNDLGRIDLFARRQASGAHEVIIESPEHLESFSQLNRKHAALVFLAYRDRLRHWGTCSDIAYAVLFKNVGFEAGASLVHAHSQLIATNILPTEIQRNVERMELFQKREQECLFCRMLRDEITESARIVAVTPRFAAYCPFASRFPSQVTIIPKRHSSSFETMSERSLDELANLVQRIIRAIEIAFPEAAYNYIVHTAPQTLRESSLFHWRIEIFPRLTKVAGFEWGSDCYINPMLPEVAAKTLKAMIT